MRSITWLASDEETAIMDLSPVEAKAHRLRVQKAAFGGFHLSKITETEGLRGRVKPGKVSSQQESSNIPS